MKKQNDPFGFNKMEEIKMSDIKDILKLSKLISYL